MLGRILVVLLFFTTHTFAKICLSLNPRPSEVYQFYGDVEVESFDGTMIAANLITPMKIEGNLPTIIFVNSWSMEEHQYMKQAIRFAKKGYQVLSYSTRGWGCSEGYVDVIGPKDIKDLHRIVDWLYENTNIDKTKLGITGLSYGGGMTLMALAKEPRIKVGFAMSAWGDLYEAMYHQESHRSFWSSMLMTTGFMLGRIGEDLKRKYRDLRADRNQLEVRNWADERSPLHHIKEINKRKVPIYISNNLGDNLFQPNNVIRLFKQLEGPKILDLNQGTHATGEIMGLFTVSNYTFNKLHTWFDYWLKGQKSDSTLKFNQINYQVDLKHDRDSVSLESMLQQKSKKFFLHPRDRREGSLKDDIYGHGYVVNKIRSNSDTFASTGIPFLSALIDGHFKIPVYTFLPFINSAYGMKFVTKKLDGKIRIRGIPKLKLNLNSDGKAFQIVAYLYDVNSLGAGKLITHGVFSGKSIDGEVDMEIVATAYDIPKGNRLALVIDTKDILYASKSSGPFELGFRFGRDLESQLEIPIN